MAGASMGDGEENPVAINVTPLIDVIFCLCVFFMCSFRFKQLEGKFDTWLPKGKGTGGLPDASDLQELRVVMLWDENGQRVIRQLGQRTVDDDGELQKLLKEGHADFVRANKPDAPVTIDAETKVPWGAVMTVVNLCKREQIDKIEFALGAPPPQ